MITQKAYPERVAQIHIINPPAILSVIMAMFKPLLKAKIRKRVSYIQMHLQQIKFLNNKLLCILDDGTSPF